MRKLLAVIACLASFGLTSVTASAAETHSNCATFGPNGQVLSVVPNCTQTVVLKNLPPQSMPSNNPCSGVPGTLTFAYTNEVFHVNVNGAGDIWLTQTLTGSVSAIPLDPTQPSYYGHITVWFGASMNKANFVFHDTFNATLTGTDGSTITLHLVDHVSANANGIVNSFSLGGFTCG
jgi:hypothetical protein